MNTLQIVVWTGGAVGGLGALYGLHRLALKLEERGCLYYLHKRGSSSAAGCFVAIQKDVEARSRHVVTIRDEIRRDVGGVPGPDGDRGR